MRTSWSHPACNSSPWSSSRCWRRPLKWCCRPSPTSEGLVVHLERGVGVVAAHLLAKELAGGVQGLLLNVDKNLDLLNFCLDEVKLLEIVVDELKTTRFIKACIKKAVVCARCDKVVCYDEIGCICVTAKLAVSHCSFPHLSNSNVENICVTAKLAVFV